MKNRVLRVVVLGLVVASLAGCGTKTEATDQASENSNIVEADGAEDTVEETEDTGSSVAAEDENIVLYAEIAEYGKYGVDTFNYVEQPGTVNAKEDILIYNDKGIEVGYIKAGSSVPVTEGAEMGGWARFKNPIEGTDYDYLYVMKEFITDPDAVILDAAGMKEGIESFIAEWTVSDMDITPVFLDEKTSDMEMYECRMDCEYQDQMSYEYWLLEQFSRKEEFHVYDYETFYVECEEDTDGWIICRVYYKDPIDFGY